jgi:F0F1-type ATP synthase assembly protein I
MSTQGSDGPSGRDLAGLGLVLAASVLVPLIGGSLLDGALHTGPLLLFVGLVVGIAAAVAVVYVGYVKRFL